MKIRVYTPKEDKSVDYCDFYYRKLLIISKNEIKYNLKIGNLRYSNVDLPDNLDDALVLIHNCGRAYLLNFEDKSDMELIRAIVEEVIYELDEPFYDLEDPIFVFLEEGQKIDLSNLKSELESKFRLVDVLHEDDSPIEPTGKSKIIEFDF